MPKEDSFADVAVNGSLAVVERLGGLGIK